MRALISSNVAAPLRAMPIRLAQNALTGIIRVCLIIAGVAFVNAASPQIANARSYESGDTLLSLCEEPQDSPLYGFCTGYIVGAADALDEGLFCPPEEHAKQQIVDVTVRWLRDNPEDRPGTAHSLVARALAEKFPCN